MVDTNNINDDKSRQEQLQQINKELHTILDLETLRNKIAEVALRVSKAKEAILCLSSTETELGMLHCTTARNDRATETGPCPPDLRPLIRYTQKLTTPAFFVPGDSLDKIGDAGQAKDWIACIPPEKNTPFPGVLIIIGEQAFSEDKFTVLSQLIEIAGIAINNALLYEEAREQSRQFRVLVESASALSWSLDLKQVLDTATRQLLWSLNTDWCIISSLDNETRKLTQLTEKRRALYSPPYRTQLNIAGLPLHREALEQSKPFAIYLAEENLSAEAKTYLQAEGCKRILFLPLLHKGEIIGLAEASNIDIDRAFNQQIIGKSLRATLQLAELMQEPETSLRNNAIIDQVRLLTIAAHAHWSTIYQKEGDSFYKLVEYGQANWLNQPGPHLNLDEHPMLRIIADEQRLNTLHITRDVNTSPEQILAAKIGEASILILPLVFHTRTVGIVQLLNTNPERRYTSREIALARALANQTTIALENAHLVRDLQNSLAREMEMQSRLVQKARLSALGELSAVIAHQINNPLTTIIGDATILIEDIPNESLSHESARAILRAGERAKGVVERVLNMARHKEEFELLDINETIWETLELVGGQITQNAIDFEVDLADNLPLIAAIPGQLEDIWMNLLMNATDAILQTESDNRHLMLKSWLAEDGTMVMVCVKDNGGGIKKEHFPQLFDPFYTTKPRGKGTGLGLYICRQIITHHKGSIDISSTPNIGTVIHVHLPVADSSKIEVEK